MVAEHYSYLIDYSADFPYPPDYHLMQSQVFWQLLIFLLLKLLSTVLLSLCQTSENTEHIRKKGSESIKESK